MKIEFDAENNFQAAYNVAGIDCSVFVEDGRVTIYLHNPSATEEENSHCEVKVCEGDCGDCPFGYDEDEDLLLEDSESTGFAHLDDDCDVEDVEYTESSAASTESINDVDYLIDLQEEEDAIEEDALEEDVDSNYALAEKILAYDKSGVIAKFVTSVLDNKDIRKLSDKAHKTISKFLDELDKYMKLS